MFQKNRTATALLLLITIIPSSSDAQKTTAQGEIIYHVFQRSFYDSNSDNIGDVNGLRVKLDYLQDLGVTSILLLPLYESVFYHNYFAGNFEITDPEFGTMQDYLNLVGLYIEHVEQAHVGADLDFLKGGSGSEVTRDSH